MLQLCVSNNQIQWVQDNAMDRIVHATGLYHDLEASTLPSFSYLNPEFCTFDSLNPTSNMAAGEQMVKHLCDALRRAKYWDNPLVFVCSIQCAGTDTGTKCTDH